MKDQGRKTKIIIIISSNYYGFLQQNIFHISICFIIFYDTIVFSKGQKLTNMLSSKPEDYLDQLQKFKINSNSKNIF